MAARHFKYTYNSEMPPKTVLSRMVTANIDDSYIDNNERNRMDLNVQRNRIYFSRRKELKYLMKSINSHLDNNSQTFFLSLYYMDLIFTHKDLEKVFYSHFMLWNNYNSFDDIQLNNYTLLSLACLIVASKFNENDPHVPTMSSYIRLLYEYSRKKYIFNLDCLYMAEVVVLKLLKYKLNYYTIYHYLIFFFTDGIVLKKTIEKSQAFKKHSERKLLERIYIQSREILDGIIDLQKYFYLYYGKDNYKIVVEIFLWSIEHIMNISIKDDENIFKLVFNINIDEKEHQEMYRIIDEIYNTKKKNNFGNNSTRMEGQNTNIKSSTNFTNVPEPNNLFSTRAQKTEMNFNYVEQKPSIPNVSSLSYAQPSYLIPPQVNVEKNYPFYSGLMYNELDKFNSNYQYNFAHPYQIPQESLVKQVNLIPQSTISYGPNNRVYLTSNKNKKDFIFNSINNIQNKNNPQDKITKSAKEFNFEKEPIDNDEMRHHIRLNHPLDGKGKIDNISKKILITNELDKKGKKSLSCSKNIFNMPHYNYNIQPRPSADINNNIENEFKKEDNIIKVNELNNPKGINNLFYNFTPKSKNISKKYEEEYLNKRILLKEFKSSNKDFYPNKSVNENYLSEKFVTKYVDEDENDDVKKPRDKPGTAINQNLKLEPQDNKRGSSKKYYYDSRIKNNTNINYGKPNTIIINNNIHINTFIDKKDIRINPNRPNKSKTSKNVVLFKGQNEKNINKMSLDDKNKIIRNQKRISEKTISLNKMNKSSIAFSNKLDHHDEHLKK